MIRTVRIRNRTGHARTGAAYFGLPFAPGELFDHHALRAIGATDKPEPVQWHPMGPRHRDGSVRYARCSVICWLDAHEDRVISVEIDPLDAPRDPFALRSEVVKGLEGFHLDLGIWPHRLVLSPASHQVVEGGRAGDVYVRARMFGRFEDVRQDPAEASLHPAYASLIMDVYPRLNHARLWYAAGYSLCQQGKGRSGGDWPEPRLRLRSNVDLVGPRTCVWRYESTVFAGVNREHAEGALWTVRAIGDTAHAQEFITAGRQFGQYMGVVGLHGELAEAERESEIEAVCLEWPEHYPPYRCVPDAPPYIKSEVDARARTEQLRKTIEPVPGQAAPYWSPRVGSWPSTGAAGDLRYKAYGPNRGMALLRPGWPSPIPELQASNRQHSQWTGWWYERDGRMWEPRDYPGTWLWWGGVHETSQDYLGWSRIDQAGPRSDMGGTEYAGPDRQHWSHLWTALDALVTGDPFAIECMEKVARQLVASLYTDRAFGGMVPSPDSPRGIGRPMVNACLAWECTGYAPLREIVRDRIKLYQQTLQGVPQDVAQGLAVYLGTVPGRGRDSQVGNLPLVEHSMPWEEAIAATGLWAVAHTFAGEPWAEDARAIAYAVSATVCGWIADWTGPDQYLLVENSRFTPAIPTRDAYTGARCVGTRSGATGTLWCARPEGQQTGIYLRDCNGQFEAGETVEVHGDPTITFEAVVRVNSLRTYTVIRNMRGEGRRQMTPEERYATYLGTPQETSHNFVGWQPMSFVPDWGTGYALWILPAVLIARDGAIAGVYGARSAEILERATRYIGWHERHSRKDDGTWAEIEEQTWVVPHAFERRAEPKPPTAPVLTHTVAGDVVTITWESDGTAADFVVHRVREDGVAEILATLFTGATLGHTSYSAVQAQDGRVYAYWVTARNPVGAVESERVLVSVGARPLPLPIVTGDPVRLTVTTSTGAEIQIEGRVRRIDQ